MDGLFQARSQTLTHARPRPLAASLLLLLIFVAVCLPTGTIFNLNVKIVLFLVCAVAFLSFLLFNSHDWPTSAELIFFFVFCLSLCLWCMIAILNGQSDTTQLLLQVKDLGSTVLIAWLCAFFVRRGLLSPESVVLTVIYSVVTLGLVKIGLIVGLFTLHINPTQMIESIFGEASLVSGDIAFGLVRMGFSSDIVGSFAIFAILCPTVSGVRFRRGYAALLITVLLISGLISYGRYIWFMDLFAIMAALSIERRFKLLVLAVIATGLAGVASYDVLRPLVEARFSSDQTTDSDLTRIEQSKALISEIKARPLFGKGLGTHARGVIRSEQTQYSYELQWMSLLMQLGIVGIVGVAVLVIAAAHDLLAARYPARLWLAALFIFWLLGSWTNPYITSSFAGATFGMFMAIFYRMRMLAESGAHAGGVDGNAAFRSEDMPPGTPGLA
jgi:hypothetical protein